MSEGYKVILKVNLPPREQYHSGASLILQGDTTADVAALVDSVTGAEGNGELILRRLVESELGEAANAKLKAALGTASTGRPPAPAGADGDSTSSDGATSTSSPSSGDAPSQTLLKAAAKKSGKDVSELEGLSKQDVLDIINGKGGE